MKQLLSVALIAFSVSANADVIKPKNTIEDAAGVVTVSGIQFDYRVRDRGWQTYANLGDGSSKKVAIVAQKSFLLSYQGKTSQGVDGLDAALNHDGATKCQELGEIEYAEQIKSVPDYQTSLKAEIVNGRAENASNGMTALECGRLVGVEPVRAAWLAG
jgi:hypothetical protein